MVSHLQALGGQGLGDERAATRRDPAEQPAGEGTDRGQGGGQVGRVRSGPVTLGALEAARPAPGESALVTAAAGGVGHPAVQLARLRGASRVVGAVSARGKAAFVRGLGADEVITYDTADWGNPVDYALDAVGGDLLSPAVAALAPGGRLVAYSSGGGSIQAYDLLVGAKSVIGFQTARIARGEPVLYERCDRSCGDCSGTAR